MFGEKIREKNVNILVKDETEFNELLNDVQNETVWKNGIIRVKYCVPSKAPDKDWGKEVTKEAIKDLNDFGGIYGILSSDEKTELYPINMSTSPFTLNDRAGITSRVASRWLEKGDLLNWVEFVNKGLATFDNSVTVLIRGGYILACNSAKYKDTCQKTVFELLTKGIISVSPTAEFISGNYTHNFTEAKYSLCSSKDKFMEDYAKAWKTAGLPESYLNDTVPEIYFKTGDTGVFPISLHPVLRIRNSYFPMAPKISEKHNGKLTYEAVEKIANMAYAGMRDGMKAIENMAKIEVKHPTAAFVRACEKTGITKKAKIAISKVLENFKIQYAFEDSVTAFDIYYAICSIQHYAEFKTISAVVKLQLLESLDRLLQLDWSSLDRVGKEEF